ncbi:MAG: CapA family protein [Lachnospiraceae bacterium]
MMSTRISIRKRKEKKELFGILCCVFILSVSGCGKESISSGGEQETIAIAEQETTAIAEQETTEIAEQETAAASEQKTVKNAEQPQKLEEPQAEEPEQVISILMVGDILLHTPVEESAHTQQDTYDFRPIFSELKEEISAADLALVNQEVIIGGQELGISGYPAFNAPFPIADALVDAGFDVVCQATNHALDKGEKGVRNDLAYWESNYPDMVVTGIQDSEEKQKMIPTVCVGDVTFAILNYTYGTNGIPLPKDMPYAVNLLEEEKVKQDLQLAEETADFTIVCPHWGTEYQLTPSAEQEYWTDIFLEGGADLVIGTHPHVIQPVEMIQNEGKEMLVYYSLGNFVNWTSGTGDGVANRMVGGMAQIEVVRENDDVVIKEYGVKPLITHVSEGYGGVRTYALEDYTVSLEQENLIKKQDSNFSLSYAETLCEKVWGEQESLW